MIPLLAAFVCIGLLAATPVFAIPSPDFLGPVLAWLVAMLGIASTFFGVLVIWIKRAAARLTPNHRRAAWIMLGAGFVITVLLVSIFAYLRLHRSKQLFEIERAQYEQADKNVPPVIPSESDEPRDPFGGIPPLLDDSSVGMTSTNLLSSRVSSSTILIPIETLHEVITESDWSDRTFLVDIRETEEREVGQIDATTTWIRYGDLINGGSAALPHDRDILVICWTSLRGKEIATWLREHGFPRAYAIQGGLQGDTNPPSQPGWIDAGLPWRGHTRWTQVFAPSYSISVDEAKQKFDAGATILDVTSPTDYQREHLTGAISFPLETLPTSEVDRLISLVPAKADLLIYCDGYVNCFYAKVLGIRLKRLGRTCDEPFNDINGEWKKQGYPMEP